MGGVQSWITTVANELKTLGHEVDIYEPTDQIVGHYDLGILAHLKYTRHALGHVDKSILVCHGIIDDEKPESGCNVTVSVSEGVRSHWGLFGEILRQPIDLSFWCDTGNDRKHLVRYSYRRSPIKFASGFKNIHVFDQSHEQSREVLQSAVCVYATGRGALEAMACGAPVVIYDHRQAYQGPLMGCDNMLLNMLQSYSGRGGHNPTQKEVDERTKQAIDRGSMRWWVEHYHDSQMIVEQILCLAS